MLWMAKDWEICGLASTSTFARRNCPSYSLASRSRTRADQTAGLAPSRPEVDHHRPALRLGQDELTEGLIGDLHDVALSGDGGHV